MEEEKKKEKGELKTKNTKRVRIPKKAKWGFGQRGGITDRDAATFGGKVHWEVG